MPADSSAKAPAAAMPGAAQAQVETRAETFDVADSLGNHLGWGYDIYVNGKKTLHQPIIPQVSGNHYFQTQADAQKVGDLVALRMRTMGGSFYSITVSDLDSLGIAP